MVTNRIRRLLDNGGPAPRGQFKNIANPLNRDSVFRCKRGCKCNTKNCPCVRNQTVCREGCGCTGCKRKFPPCECKGRCGRNCPCWRSSKMCTQSCRGSSRCNPKTCHGFFEGRDEAKTAIRESTIKVAGKGLFAVDRIEEGAFIGEYTGTVTTQPPSGDGIRQFKIASDAAIDPYEHCNVYYVNHQEKEKTNAKFLTIDSHDRPHVVLFATKDIEKGKEIFAWYGPDITF